MIIFNGEPNGSRSNKPSFWQREVLLINAQTNAQTQCSNFQVSGHAVKVGNKRPTGENIWSYVSKTPSNFKHTQ